MTEGRALTITAASLPTGLTDLDRAVYAAAGSGVTMAALPSEPGVEAALDAIAGRAESSRWGLDAAARARARRGGWLMAIITLVGLARLATGLANGKPVGFLVAVDLVAIVATALLLRVPTLSSAGRRALASQRRTNAHLAPKQSPAWSTYGPQGAAMGVALFGAAALWQADPVFSAAAGLSRQVRRRLQQRLVERELLLDRQFVRRRRRELVRRGRAGAADERARRSRDRMAARDRRLHREPARPALHRGGRRVAARPR